MLIYSLRRNECCQCQSVIKVHCRKINVASIAYNSMHKSNKVNGFETQHHHFITINNILPLSVGNRVPVSNRGAPLVDWCTGRGSSTLSRLESSTIFITFMRRPIQPHVLQEVAKNQHHRIQHFHCFRQMIHEKIGRALNFLMTHLIHGCLVIEH